MIVTLFSGICIGSISSAISKSLLDKSDSDSVSPPLFKAKLRFIFSDIFEASEDSNKDGLLCFFFLEGLSRGEAAFAAANLACFLAAAAADGVVALLGFRFIFVFNEKSFLIMFLLGIVAGEFPKGLESLIFSFTGFFDSVYSFLADVINSFVSAASAILIEGLVLRFDLVVMRSGGKSSALKSVSKSDDAMSPELDSLSMFGFSGGIELSSLSLSFSSLELKLGLAAAAVIPAAPVGV